MKRLTRLTAILIALVMVFSLQVNVFAEEQTGAIPVPVEKPSAWAADGVQWSAIYGLVQQDMLTKYQSNVNRAELYAAGANLYEKITGKEITPIEKSPFTDTDDASILKACAIKILNGSGKFEPQKEATRLEMVTVVYKVIKAAHPEFNFNSNVKLNHKDVGEIPPESLDMVKYVFSKEILKGKANDALDLDSPCTRQELMVFISRAYEFTEYESGKDSKGAFWKVSDDDSTVYLLGSIHVADPSVYPLSKAILSAYEKSDALVVEADIANQVEGIQYMQQKMMYTDGNTLDKNVPKEVYDRFVEVIKPLGIPPEIYNRLKPWYAAMLVQNVQLSQSGYDANLGIDLFFMSKASGKKRILEIEGIKFQVDMFDSFSNELQSQYLASTLNPSEETQEQQMEIVQDLMEAWKTGDIMELEKLLEVEGGNTQEEKEFNEKVFTTRNDNMTQKVKAYLADPEKKTYFIVVGAGHMNGKNGIITQLKSGYKIEQIK